MNPKSYIILLLSGVFALFLLPASLVFLVDPLFIYHKPYVYKDRGVGGTDRYLNAGLINSFLADEGEHIDTVLIGTSMSQQIPVSVIKNDNDVSPLKLTAAGGTAKELSFIVKKALDTGNVKHVIWEVYSSYMLDDTEYLHKESPLPTYLYNDSSSDDWKYVFNHDVVEKALKVLKGRKGEYTDIDQVYILDHKEEFKKFSSIQNIEKLKKKLRKKYVPLTALPLNDYSYPSVDKNLMPIITSYPDVKFSLYFPPVSYYNYALANDKNFWKRMSMIQEILKETQGVDNVSVYGFDLIPNQGSDLNNYMDASHYSAEVSKRIAQNIMQNKNTLTLEGFETYSSTLARRVNIFADKLME